MHPKMQKYKRNKDILSVSNVQHETAWNSLSESANTMHIRWRLYAVIMSPSEERNEKKLVPLQNLKAGPRPRLVMWLFRGPAATRGPINAAN